MNSNTLPILNFIFNHGSPLEWWGINAVIVIYYSMASYHLQSAVLAFIITSVCLSVCLSCTHLVSKQPKLGSTDFHKQITSVIMSCSFLPRYFECSTKRQNLTELKQVRSVQLSFNHTFKEGLTLSKVISWVCGLAPV